jgi:UPF0271 protein
MLLNLDAGEHADETTELWALADILCVACGGHAGDEASMTRVVTFIKSHSEIALGAHPSYPDREGFGRTTPPPMPPDLLAALLLDQCLALESVASRHGVRVKYVKPHGALYHDAARDPSLAAMIDNVGRTAFGEDIVVIGTAALREGFADRAVRSDGTLVPRSEPGALITNPTDAASRARGLVASGTVDTICCHADTPGSLAIVRAVRAALS